jgi:hypothetical protein
MKQHYHVSLIYETIDSFMIGELDALPLEFLALSGTIHVPAAKRNVAWDEVIRKTRRARAASRG